MLSDTRLSSFKFYNCINCNCSRDRFTPTQNELELAQEPHDDCARNVITHDTNTKTSVLSNFSGRVRADNIAHFRAACAAHAIGLSNDLESCALDQDEVTERMRRRFVTMANAYYMSPRSKAVLGLTLAVLLMDFRKLGLHPRVSMSVALSHEAPLFLLSVHDTAQLLKFMYVCARSMGHEPWFPHEHDPRARRSQRAHLMKKLQVMEGVILVAMCVKRHRHVTEDQFYWVLKLAIHVYLAIIPKLAEGDMDRAWLNVALKRNCHSMAWQLANPRVYVLFYDCFKALWVAAKRLCTADLLRETKEGLVEFCNTLDITGSVEHILERHASKDSSASS